MGGSMILKQHSVIEIALQIAEEKDKLQNPWVNS
jgi:hypothetical protein